MRYLIRSVKYLVAVCILYLLATWLMSAMGNSQMTLSQRLTEVIHTTRGQVMIAALVALAAFYPLFGFMRKRLAGNMTTHREQIIEAFEAEGFRPVQQGDREMTFRAGSPLKKLTMLYEDRIDVTQEGDFICLSGNRRAVARVHYRLQTYLDRHE